MHLNLQDILAILGPILTLMGFMWHHFNKRIDDLKVDVKHVEEKLGEKIDAVRDRVSRIEGQLVPAKVVSFEETIPKPAARPTHSKAAQAH
jgi:hypothetical protein